MLSTPSAVHRAVHRAVYRARLACHCCAHVQFVMLVVFIPTCLLHEFALLVVMLYCLDFGVAICDVLLIYDVVS